MNRSDRLDNDGLELCAWYEKMPDQGTWFSDSRIAVEVGWWIGDRQPTFKTNNPSQSEINKKGDQSRVRRTRRHVDRNDDLFAGYYYGTKRNGSGPRWSHLNTPYNSRHADTALDAAVSEQFGRARQLEAMKHVEVEREIGHFEVAKEKYTSEGKVDHAFVCHDAIRDLTELGHLTEATVRAAAKLGIAGGFGERS